MTALVAVELGRILARRLVRVVALLAVAAILVGGTVAFLTSNRDLAGARRAAERERAREVAACVNDRWPPPDQPPPGPGFDQRAFCESQIVVQPRDPRFHLASLEGIYQGMAVLAAAIGLLVGASFIGAEWHHRTITTTLTWEARRVRMLAVKALVCALVVFVGVAVLHALLGAALVPAAALRGTMEGTGAAWSSRVAAAALRASALAGLVAVMGFSLAAIGRNTAAGIGVGFAYATVLEGLLRGLARSRNLGWPRWFLGDNAGVFITGRPADPFDLVMRGRTVTTAGLVVAAYAAVLLAAAAVQFHRRDVA
jgi:ABC-type transport system involved in multi-copper enzyme maturation permease subunit